MSDRPNFLFIMTDQHRADWLGCYGHPVVRTPHIDRLAARGVRMTDFHVASPVCMPNRASFMTGRYPSVHGLRYNGCILPKRAHSFVDVLKAEGYRTATIGKSHLQPMTESAPFVPPDLATGVIDEAWKAEDGYYEAEEPGRYREDGSYDFPTPYYGYDHVDMVTLHGANAGGHYLQWFREKHGDWTALRDPNNQLAHNYSCPQAWRTPIPEESYPTAYVRDRAAAYLRKQADEEAPFFAFVSFPDPHHPFTPPGKYWNMYSPDDFDLPVRYDDHQNPPPPLRACHGMMTAGDSPAKATTGFMVSDAHAREAMALSAGMITMIDDAVGALVATLKETGQFDRTVIVFNADHGDYLGDYNLLLKGPWLNEAITRVPMIWSDPDGSKGVTSDILGSTVDLAPTVLARAGLAGFNGMQGESLLRSFDRPKLVRDSMLVEYNDGLCRMGFETPARVRSLMTKDWRLTVYRGQDWGELYDRQGDPLQTHNLWDEPQHAAVRAELTENLVHHLIAQMDESPRGRRLA